MGSPVPEGSGLGAPVIADGSYTFSGLAMEPFGSDEFSIEEVPAELKIRYGRHAGWIERILAPVAVPALIAAGWLWQKPLPILGGAGLIMILIFRWAWGHQSVLRVLSDRLIASSYLQSPAETALSEIKSMKWLRRDVLEKYSGPQGLYISCAGRSNAFFRLSQKNRQKLQPTQSPGNFRNTRSMCLFLGLTISRRLSI